MLHDRGAVVGLSSLRLHPISKALTNTQPSRKLTTTGSNITENVISSKHQSGTFLLLASIPPTPALSNVLLNSSILPLYLSLTASTSSSFFSAIKTPTYASASLSKPRTHSSSNPPLTFNLSSSLTSQTSFLHRNTSSVIGPIFPPPFVPAITSSTQSL